PILLAFAIFHFLLGFLWIQEYGSRFNKEIPTRLFVNICLFGNIYHQKFDIRNILTNMKPFYTVLFIFDDSTD
ncbi:hypothetical protein L9F63_025526, partial [Diploptera punctata]